MRFWYNRQLIYQFIKREVVGRYKGSYLGIIWSFLTPLFMLAIYTFVFSMVFQARWNTSSSNKLEFALIIFAGMIAFNIFSEVVVRSPSLIINNANYVKKMVFPLEILTLSVLGASLINALINVCILTIGSVLFLGILHWTVLLVPIVLLPIVLMTLGIGWFLSSIGTYFRDIGQITGLIVSALMFLSPIFYPVTNIPKELQFLYFLNPLSHVVEDMRSVLIFGQMPNWIWVGTGTVIGLLISYIGFLWFEKTRGGFADVL